MCQKSDMIVFFRELEVLFKLCRESFVASFVDPNKVLIVIDTKGRAGPARRRATRRSRVGTPLPVPTGPVPKRSVPTRLRRVAHSNGRAIRLGIRTSVNSCAPPGDPS